MNHHGWEKFSRLCDKALQEILGANQLRELVARESYPDTLIDLSTNDYLGLRNDLKFQAICREAVEDNPVGAGASRLLGGEHTIMAKAEDAFARFKGAESALLFHSGYAANETVASVLGTLGRINVFSDELNHASIIDGIRLTRNTASQKFVFPHQDYNTLIGLLKNNRDSDLNVIITESLYSMDGDQTDLNLLQSIAMKHNGILVVDEAHALGVFGTHGAGLISEQQVNSDNVISINPCGKALGVQGAFVAGPRWFRELMINRGRPFIFATGISPWLAACLLESITYTQELDDRRQKVLTTADSLRRELNKRGFDTGISTSQIVPIILDDESKTLAFRRELLLDGVSVGAIRPPTVPKNTCRLRLSLTAEISWGQVEHVLNTLSKIDLIANRVVPGFPGTSINCIADLQQRID